MNRRIRATLAALAAVVIATPLGWTTWPGAGWSSALPAGTPSAHPRPAPHVDAVTVESADRAQIQTLLDDRADALLSRDKSAFLRDVAGGFRTPQAALFDNLVKVPLQSWTYALTDQVSSSANPVYGGQVATFVVEFGYQLAGFDQQPDVHQIVLTFARPDGARWQLVSDSDGDSATWRGLWDYGPVIVIRSIYGLLLAHPGREAALLSLAQAIDQAVPAVSSVWGTAWTQRVVILVPDTTAELQRVGRVSFGIDRLAAVAIATSVDYESVSATGQRVLLNPDTLGQLGPNATFVLMTHEITHLAARTATMDSTPTWLVEGFADFVGFSAVNAKPKQVAAGLGVQIRAGATPVDLPSNAQFAVQSAGLNGVYAQAWLAARLIAERIGVRSFVAMYRTIAKSADPAAALTKQLKSRLGLSRVEFVSAWITSLKANLL